MPCDNLTAGGSFVALNLSAQHVSSLRDKMTDWLDGLRRDLRAPEKLKEPSRAESEAQAVERLLVGLTVGQLFVPDPEAEALLRASAESNDKESNYVWRSPPLTTLSTLCSTCWEGRAIDRHRPANAARRPGARLA
jgi:hypothetical protein